MSRFTRHLILFSLLLPSVTVVPGSAEDTQQPTLADLEKMLLEQKEMLAKQQALIEQQAKDLETQGQAILQLRTDLDQLSVSGGEKASGPSAEESELRQRLTKVEEEVANPPDKPEDVLTAGDFPGSIRIPGTDMSGKFGGFVRLGTVDSFDPIGSTDRFVAGTIPVYPDDQTQTEGFNEGVVISAKRSRLNWDMRLDSHLGQFRAFLEGDFAGQSGDADGFRLRHAYGQYNRFLLGQTWSTLMDLSAIPEEVDFEGLNAQLNVRQPELRWTKGLGNDTPFALGFEDPNPSITGGTGISRFPDVVARISRNKPWGHLQAGFILRNIRGVPVDESGAELTSEAQSAFGWGLTFSGNMALKKWDSRDNFKFQVNGGYGLGRYINDLGTVGGFDAIFDDETGGLETIPVVAAYGAFQHWWRRNPFGLFKAVRSTIVYGYVLVGHLETMPADFYRSTQRASVNWLWSPIAQIDLGVEVLYGTRKNQDREKGTARQFQFVATYRF